MNEKVRGVDSIKIQVDEIWTFVGKKQKRVTKTDPHQFGDQYVYVAIDSTDEWILKTTQESEGCCGPALRLLQFLSSTQHLAGHARDGIKDHGSCIDS